MGKAIVRPRRDPKRTAADGFRQFERLERRDPNRHYVLVNPNDEISGVSMYEAAGYTIEQYTEGGVRAPLGNHKDGAWHVMGQVLMSCAIEDLRATEAAGQAYSDQIDNKMLKSGNIEKDGFRGRGYSVGVNTSVGRADERMGAPSVEQENV